MTNCRNVSHLLFIYKQNTTATTLLLIKITKVMIFWLFVCFISSCVDVVNKYCFALRLYQFLSSSSHLTKTNNLWTLIQEDMLTIRFKFFLLKSSSLLNLCIKVASFYFVDTNKQTATTRITCCIISSCCLFSFMAIIKFFSLQRESWKRKLICWWCITKILHHQLCTWFISLPSY